MDGRKFGGMRRRMDGRKLVGCDDGWDDQLVFIFYLSIYLFGKSILAEGSVILLLASRSPIASRLSVGRGGSQ